MRIVVSKETVDKLLVIWAVISLLITLHGLKRYTRLEDKLVNALIYRLYGRLIGWSMVCLTCFFILVLLTKL